MKRVLFLLFPALVVLSACSAGSFDLVSYVGNQCGVDMQYMHYLNPAFRPGSDVVPSTGQGRVAWMSSSGQLVTAVFATTDKTGKPEYVSCGNGSPQ